MRKEYGSFGIEWRKIPGTIQVDYDVYDPETGDTAQESDTMPLFDFLSSLGITMTQCVNAFIKEDEHLK
jgi:hypothetical protein